VVVGVAAGGAGPSAVLLAGTAALVAGAVSMAAGEYVSVQSQADTERSDLALEREELAADPSGERAELRAIYQSRGLDRELAGRVADALTEHDALGAHARDELGITEALKARPVQAAATSEASFVVGAVFPLLAALAAPPAHVGAIVGAVTLVTLSLLGGLAGFVGGASIWRGAVRVTFWGALAMALTAAVGSLFGGPGGGLAAALAYGF
jgi:VIT1/CCC1 family predicted Fe2+/Mn2+ transporter